MRASLLVAAGGLLSSAGAVTVTQLLHSHNNRTWYGDSAIALQGAGDPIAMTTTWVYAPVEVLGFRTKSNTTWRYNTTSELKYQTLYVTSTGVPSPGKVDSLAWWNEKPDGITGTCALIGFNSGTAPNVDTPGPGQWKTVVSTNCTNVNLWSSFVWMALSDDGATAVTWVMLPDQTYIISAFDGQTGAHRWSLPLTPGSNPSGAPFECYGVSISRDGRFVITDSGLDGVGLHSFHVLNAADGSVRGVVQGAALIQSFLSPDGSFLYAQDSLDRPEATVHAWNASAGKYERAGVVKGPMPADSPTDVYWYLTSGGFGTDAASGRTVLALGWLTSDLSGHQSVGVWDVTTAASLQAGPVACYNTSGNGDQMAVDGQEIKCAGAVCAAALMTQKVGAGVPTVLVFDGSAPAGAAAPPAWTYATTGSMLSVDVAVDGAVAYVAAAGCDTDSVCTKRGADMFMWQVSL